MRISIPKPCHENWNEMSPETQGAFCKVCSKIVVDFSKMSDGEIISYFEKKKKERTCGRFRISQLSPYELKVNLRSIATQKSLPKILAVTLFLFFSSLFICKSDTGEYLKLNIIANDTIDTSSVVLQIDSAKISPDTTSVSETDSSQTELMVEGKVATLPEINAIDTPLITRDTVVTPMVLGNAFIPAGRMMGEAVCTPTPKTQEKNPKPPKEKMIKGKMMIVDDIDF